jgi:hypothetical protein
MSAYREILLSIDSAVAQYGTSGGLERRPLRGS